MRAHPLPLLALALLLAQCHQKAPDPAPADPTAALPPETQTGAGTFGCLVNGKAYSAPYSLYANGDWMSQTRLGISGTIYENGVQTASYATVNLGLNGDLANSKPPVFILIPAGLPHTIFTTGVNQFFAGVNAPNNAYYSGQYIKTGQVTLTKFDGVARIASGRFAFTLYEVGRPDTLKVTNGRFDVKF